MSSTVKPAADTARLLRLLLVLIFSTVLVRTAWLSDDALITLRTVLNVTHGYGLTFNIAERVQTFTHPLWMMLLTGAYLVVGNVYIAMFALSIATSMVVFWLAIRRAATPAHLAIVAVTLLCSRAFVDFSTSGLENPLANLLLGLFVITALRSITDGRPNLVTSWLLGSLLYLTRPDFIVLIAPALAMLTLRASNWRSATRSIAAGLTPAIAWTLFSLLYYGSATPNTAAAKLGTGIPRGELWYQGFLYLLDSLDRDPLTLVAIALAIAGGAFVRGVPRYMAAGLTLYLVYVASIGGDFMSGRFLATPLFASAISLGWLIPLESRLGFTAAGLLGVVGLASAQIPLLSDSRFHDAAVKSSGLSDERALNFPGQSLVRANRHRFEQPAWPRAGQSPVTVKLQEGCGLLGAGGLASGPHTHMLDDCALADPLLARLPAMFNPNWRIGHFRRLIPDGYREGLIDSSNKLADPSLRPLYDDVRLATRASSLWTRERLRAIWRLNTGHHRSTFDRQFYRHGGSLVAIETRSQPLANETPWDAPGTSILRHPLAITCEDRLGRRHIDIALDSNDRYVLTFLKRNRIIAQMEVGPIPAHRRRSGLAAYTENLPLRATEEGFDTIVVAGDGGDQLYSVGHVLLDGNPATQDELNRRVSERDRMTPK